MFVRQFGLAMLVSTLASGAAAQSGVLAKDFEGCVTERHLDQLYEAYMAVDQRLVDSLMGVYCIRVDGLPVSMLDSGFMVSEVRVYLTGATIDLFVPASAARPK